MARFEKTKYNLARFARALKPTRENFSTVLRTIRRLWVSISDAAGKIPAHRLIPLSFAVIILIGTVALCLPISTAGDAQVRTPFVNAFFTATSATCVTGLSPYDTLTHWTLFGQIVILLLIQIGGLGAMTIVTSFAMTLHRKLGFRDLRIAQESTGYVDMGGVTSILKTIAIVTLCCEAVGALMLSIRFVPQYGWAQGIYKSVFHAISAFCNAGFDLMGKQNPSMTGYSDDPLVCLTLSALFIIGGLGYVVFYDIFTCRKEGRRLSQLTLHTKLVLITSGILLVAGTLLFLISEYNGTLSGMTFGEKLLNAFFQSACARSAGFYSVDLAQTNSYTRLLLIVLMFIGASPGSTGGGVKTTTAVVLLFTVICALKGQENPVIWHRRMSHSTVYKAIALAAVAMLIVLCTSAVIVIESTYISTSEVSIIDAIFEATSAFGTCGTTVGVTSTLGVVSKIVLCLAMFIGRVGPISLSLSINSRSNMRDNAEILPEARIIAG